MYCSCSFVCCTVAKYSVANERVSDIVVIDRKCQSDRVQNNTCTFSSRNSESLQPCQTRATNAATLW